MERNAWMESKRDDRDSPHRYMLQLKVRSVWLRFRVDIQVLEDQIFLRTSHIDNRDKVHVNDVQLRRNALPPRQLYAQRTQVDLLRKHAHIRRSRVIAAGHCIGYIDLVGSLDHARRGTVPGIVRRSTVHSP